MLAIRMQRLGRKGHPTYRVVVQDVRQTPTSGKYVALLGSYDPHSKTTTLVKEKAETYLTNGAQPSERVARLFVSEGITLPDWVKQPEKHTRGIRNAEKLRKNQPKSETPKEEPAEDPAETTVEEVAETPSEEVEVAEAAPEDTAEETAAEQPAPEKQA
jgi:small subunit ribosomal protein S16